MWQSLAILMALSFWGSKDDDTKGSYDAWWPYEQTAYWIDGALKCGYLAGDEALYHQALEEVDFAIDHAAPDGFIGPDSLREKDRWPHAVFFRAVLAQYEISGDPRYLEALVRHYRAIPHPDGLGPRCHRGGNPAQPVPGNRTGRPAGNGRNAVRSL